MMKLELAKVHDREKYDAATYMLDELLMEKMK